MLELIRNALLNPIQVSAEVNAALKEHTLVVVTKRDGTYEIHVGQGEVKDGRIIEHDD